jgi:hypothetical protein
MLFFREMPVATAAAITGSEVGFGEGIGVGTGDVEGGGGVDDVDADRFRGEVGGGFSILLLAPLIKIRLRFLPSLLTFSVPSFIPRSSSR